MRKKRPVKRPRRKRNELLIAYRAHVRAIDDRVEEIHADVVATIEHELKPLLEVTERLRIIASSLSELRVPMGQAASAMQAWNNQMISLFLPGGHGARLYDLVDSQRQFRPKKPA